MKKIAVLVLFMLLLVPFSIRADKTYVVDQADLLTQEEEAELEAKLQSVSDQVNADVVVLTVNNIEEEDLDEYADDFFDYNGYGRGDYYDGVLLLLDLFDDGTGRWYFSTSGDGVRAFPDWRIDEAGETIYPYLKNRDYYGAFNAYADLCLDYFGDRVGDYMVYENGDFVTFDIDGNIVVQTNLSELKEDVVYAILTDGSLVEASTLETQPYEYTYFVIKNGDVREVNPDPPPVERETPWAAMGGGSGVTGLIASAIYVARERGKLKSVNRKYQASEYYRKGSMDIRNARDIFLYRNVSRTRIQTSSSSSSSGGGGHSSGGGGSHVHISSSGHTHGGGGGRF